MDVQCNALLTDIAAVRHNEPIVFNVRGKLMFEAFLSSNLSGSEHEFLATYDLLLFYDVQ
uniref:Uncharacterized protein n=1 Tax=Onchocerca volvulus TaxID=6282 RepID=A0A8R1TUZ8_ONCVO